MMSCEGEKGKRKGERGRDENVDNNEIRMTLYHTFNDTDFIAV